MRPFSGEFCVRFHGPLIGPQSLNIAILPIFQPDWAGTQNHSINKAFGNRAQNGLDGSLL